MEAYVHQKTHTHTQGNSNRYKQTQSPMLTCRWENQHSLFSSAHQPFYFSLQSPEHNLQDEVMHNGVKWKLFISLTHEVKLCSSTKLGFEPET